MEIGNFYDGTKYSIAFGPSLSIGSDLKLSLNYNFDHINIEKRELAWSNHLIYLKSQYTPSTKLSMNIFLQYNKSVNKIFSNFRIRFNPKDGSGGQPELADRLFLQETAFQHFHVATDSNVSHRKEKRRVIL